MKRFLILLLAVAAATGMLAGCSGNGGTLEGKERSAEEVGESIRQAAELPDMKQGDLEKLEKLYHIESGEVEDFILFTASSNVKADELAVLKVKDVSKVDHVKGKIQQRIDEQTVKFKDYRPEEYYLIRKHVLKTKGPFVLFAVSQEAGQIERAFEEALK